MKAWRIHETGNYRDVLKWEETEKPQVWPNTTLIKVHAAGINFPDLLFASGGYQIKPELPFTLGLEAVGTVVEVGEGSRYKVGDRIGVTSLGGAFAEYMMAPDVSSFLVPDDMTDVDAAAIRLIYETSHMACMYAAELKADEYLLVHGGAGGVGTAAIQVGKAAGATVIATATGQRDIQVCYDQGADHVIDWRNEDIVSRVKELTDNHGADVVYDPVGGDAFDASTHCIAFEGRLVVIGFASGRIPSIKAHMILNKNMSVMGFFWTGYAMKRPDLVDKYQEEINALYTEGKFKPVVSQALPMEKLLDGLDTIDASQAYGKIVVVNKEFL